MFFVETKTIYIKRLIVHNSYSYLLFFSLQNCFYLTRYESTVTAQFFGHVHNEMFTMFYDEVQFKRPTSVLYNPGSVTTFSNLNPGFRIYEVDGHYNGSSWVYILF